MPTSDATFSIQRWLDELPEEEIQREMAVLNEEIQNLSARINTLRGALELKQRFRNIYDPHAGSGSVPLEVQGATATTGAEARTTAQREPRPGSIRESVLLLTASTTDLREWTTKEIYDGLVSHGWLEPSNQALRSLSAALSRMTSVGEIRRVSRGVYSHVFPETSPSLLDPEGGDPD